MKKIITLITMMCLIALAGVSAYAEDVNAEILNFTGHAWNGEISEDTPDRLVISNNIVISSDLLLNQKQIRIEDNGILEITDGANLTLYNTSIFIENGGTMIVSDGTVTFDGTNSVSNSSVKNVGTIVIASKGKFDVKKGAFSSTSESNFICNGKISCVTEKHFNKAIATIKNYDNNFSFNNYSMYVYASSLSSATIQFKYCIDKIETSYKYTATLNKKSGIKVTRSPIELSKVYNDELRRQLLDRTCAYEASNELPADFYSGIKREYYYLYNYTKKTLISEYLYFTIAYDEDCYMTYDNTEQTSIL